MLNASHVLWAACKLCLKKNKAHLSLLSELTQMLRFPLQTRGGSLWLGSVSPRSRGPYGVPGQGRGRNKLPRAHHHLGQVAVWDFAHVLKCSGNTCARGTLSRYLVVLELVAMLAVQRPFPLGQGMLQEAVSPVQAQRQATSSEECFTCVASNARRQLGLGDSAGRLLMDLGSSSCPKYHT